MMQKLGVLLALFTALATGPLFAQDPHGDQDPHKAPHGEEHAEAEEEGFNAGETIIHHISDAYEIHFFTLNENSDHPTHVSIPLPVIMYTDNGLDIFSSSVFHHGHNTYTGASGIEYAYAHGKIHPVDENVHPIDLSLTKSSVGALLAVLIMLLLFTSAARAYKKRPGQAPKGLQNLLEPLIIFIRDEVAKPTIGHKYERYMPFLLAMFFFILIANLMGLIPFIGGFNITGTIAVPVTLAVLTFLVTTFSGNKNYWGHIFYPPGVPLWLLPIMVPIEIMGVLMKPLVLTLRLFANITAGHIVILSFTSLIFIFAHSSGAATGYGVSVGSLAFTIFINFLELLVAFLQAYVFTLLSAIYFGSAVEEAHH